MVVWHKTLFHWVDIPPEEASQKEVASLTDVSALFHTQVTHVFMNGFLVCKQGRIVLNKDHKIYGSDKQTHGTRK